MLRIKKPGWGFSSRKTILSHRAGCQTALYLKSISSLKFVKKIVARRVRRKFGGNLVSPELAHNMSHNKTVLWTSPRYCFAA